MELLRRRAPSIQDLGRARADQDGRSGFDSRSDSRSSSEGLRSLSVFARASSMAGVTVRQPMADLDLGQGLLRPGQELLVVHGPSLPPVGAAHIPDPEPRSGACSPIANPRRAPHENPM